MNIKTLTRCAITVALVSIAGTASAQQAFEEKYVAARPGGTELVPMPTIAIVPAGSAPLHADVAAQLSEAVQDELDGAQENRFEIVTRPAGGAVGWAFVVRNAPRTAHDGLTPQLTNQLIKCLQSLDGNGVEVAAINALLTAGTLDDAAQRELAYAAGRQMLVHWKADQCRTRRNDLPYFERNRARLTVATRGMLTDVFDPTVYNGQGLLDIIRSLYGLYYHPGGFWTAEMTPLLSALFEAGVGNGLLTTAQTAAIADQEVDTFWDWVLLVVSTKASVVRSFVEKTADGCARTIPELSRPFQLAGCVADGKIALVPLRVDGRDYTTVQRVGR